MAQQTPPFALQNASHSAALFRQAVSSLLYQAGPMDGTSYVVSAQSTPNMTVQVAGGWTWADGTQVASVTGQNFSTQASYFGINDAPATLTIATANGTNPRIDVVYAAVADQQYSGSTNNIVLGVQTGTAASSPLVPTLPVNAIDLAHVRVNASVTSILNTNITATSTGQSATAGGLVVGTPIPCTSGTRPSGTRLGQPIYETDTQRLLVQNGGSFTPVMSFTVVCTSGTRPTSPLLGQYIYETDTASMRLWTGSAWALIPNVTSWTAFVPTSTTQLSNVASGPVGGGANSPVWGWRVEGNRVFCRGWTASTAGIAPASALTTAIPAAFRPPAVTSLNVSIDSPSTMVELRLEMDTTGVMYCWHALSAGSYLNFDQVSWPLS